MGRSGILPLLQTLLITILTGNRLSCSGLVTSPFSTAKSKASCKERCTSNNLEDFSDLFLPVVSGAMMWTLPLHKAGPVVLASNTPPVLLDQVIAASAVS